MKSSSFGVTDLKLKKLYSGGLKCDDVCGAVQCCENCSHSCVVSGKGADGIPVRNKNKSRLKKADEGGVRKWSIRRIHLTTPHTGLNLSVFEAYLH